MTYKGVIFDFNGTLLWDTAMHNKAWDMFLFRHSILLTDTEKNEIIHGRNNEDIFPDLFRRSMSNEEIGLFIHEKEAIYRELFTADPLDFAPGAGDFIRFLNDRGTGVAIATASGYENVDFYLTFLGLGKLVKEQHIIYNNGRIKSKPHPEIFEIALASLGLKGEEAIIFEDSFAGIRAAENAGAGKVVIVNSTDNDYSTYGHQVITSFDQVDRHLFSQIAYD
jgi:HAD superfamily hydrolase (TIGR01509 family)